MKTLIELGFRLGLAHAIGDYGLQPDRLSKYKNRNEDLPKSRQEKPTWIFALFAHALINGGLIYLFTNSLIIGLSETLIHFSIDFIRAETELTIKGDQLLHGLCLLGYWLYLGGII